MKGMNIVYDVKRDQHFLIVFARAILYTLLLILTLVLSLVLLVYGPALLEYLQSLSAKQSFWEGLISFLQSTRYFVFGFILIPVFMFLYDSLAAGKRKFKKQFPRGGFLRRVLDSVFLGIFHLCLVFGSVRRLWLSRHRHGRHDVALLLYDVFPDRRLYQCLFYQSSAAAGKLNRLFLFARFEDEPGIQHFVKGLLFPYSRSPFVVLKNPS